jgi:endonuclease/exonuclease/phosphatase (EEP) superfamily protein YafD
MTGTRTAAGTAATVVAFGVGCAGLAGALFALGGRRHGSLDVLTHFAVLWLAASAVAAGAGLLSPWRMARVGLLLVGTAGMLAAGWLMAPEYARPIRSAGKPQPGRQIRLIQFNAWQRNTDPLAAADWIASESPDVVALEDVTPPLARALVARGFRPARGMVSTMIFSRGLAVLPPIQIPFRDWALLPDFARARFRAPGASGAFSVVAIHLTRPNQGDTGAAGERMAELLARQPKDRLIIVGDFNLTPWSFTLARLDRRLGLERRDRAVATWPACPRPGPWPVCVPPFLPIDHVYAGPAWRTVAITRGPRLGSDHYPLVVDLALEP